MPIINNNSITIMMWHLGTMIVQVIVVIFLLCLHYNCHTSWVMALRGVGATIE